MKKCFCLFIAAIAVTFSMIALLQFVEVPWFFLVLLAMHGGVFLFIFSKKRFKAQGYDVARFYSLEYKLLALYLPILALKVLSSLEILRFDATLKTVLILVITAFSLIVSVVNAIKMYKYLKDAK
jgi:hypothetical protein